MSPLAPFFTFLICSPNLQWVRMRQMWSPTPLYTSFSGQETKQSCATTTQASPSIWHNWEILKCYISSRFCSAVEQVSIRMIPVFSTWQFLEQWTKESKSQSKNKEELSTWLIYKISYFKILLLSHLCAFLTPLLSVFIFRGFGRSSSAGRLIEEHFQASELPGFTPETLWDKLCSPNLQKEACWQSKRGDSPVNPGIHSTQLRHAL